MKRCWKRLAGVLMLILSSSAARGDGQLLTAADARTGQGFGFSLDVSGDRLAVGGPWDDDLGPGAGAVYLFERQAGIWVQTSKLTAFDGGAGHTFGWDVALEGDLLAVSARGRVAGSVTGVVYVYAHDGTSWVHRTTLVPGGANPYPPQEDFAVHVEVAGGRIAASGEYRDQYGALYGRFHVFSEDQGTWTRELVRDHYNTRTLGFGAETLAPGSIGTHDVVLHRGVLFVHDHDAASGNWIPGGALYGDADPFHQDRFGASVAVDGERIAVTAPDDTLDVGAVYFFHRNAGVWEREARVAPLGGGHLWTGFGSLALAGDWMLVAGQGVLVFRRDGTEWAEDHVIAVPPGADSFGNTIRLDGSTAAVGAWGYDGAAADIGAVFVYALAPLVSRYCPSAPNSSGAGARIDVGGTMSVAANDARLFLSSAPAGVAGIFFYGQSATLRRVGDGYLCIDPTTPVFRRYPLVTTGADGSAQTLLDFPTLPGSIVAGSTWNFQCNFRDVAAGGFGFNMTDAVAVTFLP